MDLGKKGGGWGEVISGRKVKKIIVVRAKLSSRDEGRMLLRDRVGINFSLGREFLQHGIYLQALIKF